MVSYLALMSGQDHEENRKQNERVGAWCLFMLNQNAKSVRGHIKRQRRIKR